MISEIKKSGKIGKHLLQYLILLFFLLCLSCNSVDPPPPGEKPTLTLTLEDVSCIEAWIKLNTTNLQLPASITLLQDGWTRETININANDTLLYIDSLLPNTSYQYQASSIQYQVSSNELSVTTLDTTSHNFNWQTWTFGEHSHSRLNDLAIINENNIIAVGEIYMNDSLGNPDNNPYNAVHWDGSQWELKKISVLYNGNLITPPLYGIYAFSDTEIWLSSGVPVKGDGINWTQYHLFDMGILTQNDGHLTKIWGASSTDLYYVGNKGTIARYQNGTWSRIESGTDVDLRDVWGTEDGTVWACGYSGDYGISALLKIRGQQVEKIYEGLSSNQNNGYYVGPIGGVWGTENIRIYLMNWSGIYIQANSSNLFLEKEIAKFSDVGFGIDGSDDNNIFSCGEGFIGHWNGISYTEYPELYKSSRTFLNVSVKENTVAAVGSDYNSFIYSQAVIALAK